MCFLVTVLSVIEMDYISSLCVYGARWVMTFERLMGWYEKNNNTHTFELVCVIRKNMESMLRGKYDHTTGGWCLCVYVHAYKSASNSLCFLAISAKG